MGHYIPKIQYGVSNTEIAFDYPPSVDDGEQIDVVERVSKSISGVRQVSIDSMEVQRNVKYSFLSESLKTALYTFFASHAGYGKSFKYFDDKNSGSFVYYELDTLKFQPKKIAPVTANTYIWELAFKFRRVLGIVSGDETVYTILNNQASPVSLAGLSFDSADYSSVVLTCELRRTTDSQEVVSNVLIYAQYREDTDDWDITTEVKGEDTGVTFSITSAGQLQYISDNQSGSNYVGTLKVKSSNFSA